MIDFHTHILPGIDDGCKSVEDSVEVLLEQARQGVTEVVLTPHFYSDSNDIPRFLARRQRAWEKLQPFLTEEMPSVRLGAEVQYFEGICWVEGLEQLCIQDSNLLLLEMPFSKWPERVIEDVLELNSRSEIQIVLAHVERYLGYQAKKTLPRLLDAGVFIQSNVSFFADWKSRLQAVPMLDRGEIHVLGSDCHNNGHRAPNWKLLPRKLWNKVKRANLLFAARYFVEDTLDLDLYEDDRESDIL